MVSGMAYDRSGSPVAFLEISVNGQTRAVSDYAGRFSLAGMLPGTYELTARKEECEPSSSKVKVESPTQVIYLSMVTADDLLDMAENAMSKGDWPSADALAQRALTIAPTMPEARFMAAAAKASPYRKDRDPATATEILEALVNDGYGEGPVLTLLDDLKNEGEKPR
jgi:hypothetical protein